MCARACCSRNLVLTRLVLTQHSCCVRYATVSCDGYGYPADLRATLVRLLFFFVFTNDAVRLLLRNATKKRVAVTIRNVAGHVHVSVYGGSERGLLLGAISRFTNLRLLPPIALLRR